MSIPREADILPVDEKILDVVMKDMLSPDCHTGLSTSIEILKWELLVNLMEMLGYTLSNLPPEI
jgi:hypothetical protein